MKKKILLSFMMICIGIFAFGILNVSAYTGTKYGDLYYTVLAGEAIISDCSTSAETIEIPSEISGYPVTSIGYSAFYNCTGLTSITIPDSVTGIGSRAFSGCSRLTSITIPDSVTGIGDSAFYYCTGLKSITIPDSVTSIGGSAFYGCGSLTSLTIPDSVTSIGGSAFYGCTSLANLTIGNGVMSIGYSAFYGCSSLTSLTIPSVNQICEGYENLYSFGNKATVGRIFSSNIKSITLTNETAIPDNAFASYENLTDITLNDGITSIGANAFDNCGYENDETNWDGEYLYLGNYLIDVKPTVFAAKVKDGTTVMIDGIFSSCDGLLKATLPESLINIPNNAFYYCDELLSVNIPSKIITIGDSAFYYCDKLTKINIPDTVTQIGEYAFYGCNKLNGVYITDIEAWCKIIFHGSAYFIDNYYSHYQGGNPLCYAGNLYINDVLVENVVIPDNVTQLNDGVFYNCRSLKGIKLSDNLVSIGGCAFLGCSGLTSITLPENVKNIGSNAFYNCGNLTTVNIPSSVTSIGRRAFYYCRNIDDVYITDLSAWCKLDFSDLDSNPLRYGANLYLNNTLVKELSIPSDITTINKNQFYNCGSITAVKIHSKVEKIEENAFYGCENIEYVEIPKDLFYIRNNAFYGCDSLTEVHYGGTESEWEEIIIADGNDSLKNARVKSIYYITLIDDDGKTSSITCLPNEKIKISDIEKKYMHKVTLYTDSEMTKEFDTGTAIPDNMTLYAKLGEEITVISGDIDDDGEITMNDAIYLFNAAMFPDEYPIPAGQKTDYNGDGTFDMNDAIYLFNHAMFPEEYPI